MKSWLTSIIILITWWICWKFHDIGGSSDLSETINKLLSVKKPCILKYAKNKDKSQFSNFFHLASEAWTLCKLLSKVKNELKTYNVHMWLWNWYFYHSCLHIDGRIMFWILNNLTLTLRDTLERTPKVISNQNLFSRSQSWYWFWC